MGDFGPTRNGALLIVTVSLFAYGCGDSKPKTPTAPTPTPTPVPAPDVSGRYTGGPLWVLQVLRTSDNFQTSFNCNGTMTISQSPGNYSVAGFMASSGPCEPVSFELTGSFEPGGAVTFRSDGPRPPQGPCPGGKDIEFRGTFTNSNRLLSARGVTRVQCPEFGEHVFTYLVTANR
jgi:hypothetical protein